MFIIVFSHLFGLVFSGLAGRGGEGERGATAAPSSASEGTAGTGGAGPAERLSGGAAQSYSPANQPRDSTGRSGRKAAEKHLLQSHDAIRLSDIILRPWQISSLQLEHEEQEQRICQYEEDLVQAREELLALQEESRRLQEKVQAAQEQLTPLQESVRDSFTQVAQVGFIILKTFESQVNFLLLHMKMYSHMFAPLHPSVLRFSRN